MDSGNVVVECSKQQWSELNQLVDTAVERQDAAAQGTAAAAPKPTPADEDNESPASAVISSQEEGTGVPATKSGDGAAAAVPLGEPAADVPPPASLPATDGAAAALAPPEQPAAPVASAQQPQPNDDEEEMHPSAFVEPPSDAEIIAALRARVAELEAKVLELQNAKKTTKKRLSTSGPTAVAAGAARKPLATRATGATGASGAAQRKPSASGSRLGASRTSATAATPNTSRPLWEVQGKGRSVAPPTPLASRGRPTLHNDRRLGETQPARSPMRTRQTTPSPHRPSVSQSTSIRRNSTLGNAAPSPTAQQRRTSALAPPAAHARRTSAMGVAVGAGAMRPRAGSAMRASVGRASVNGSKATSVSPKPRRLPEPEPLLPCKVAELETIRLAKETVVRGRAERLEAAARAKGLREEERVWTYLVETVEPVESANAARRAAYAVAVADRNDRAAANADQKAERRAVKVDEHAEWLQIVAIAKAELTPLDAQADKAAPLAAAEAAAEATVDGDAAADGESEAKPTEREDDAEPKTEEEPVETAEAAADAAVSEASEEEAAPEEPIDLVPEPEPEAPEDPEDAEIAEIEESAIHDDEAEAAASIEFAKRRAEAGGAITQKLVASNATSTNVRGMQVVDAPVRQQRTPAAGPQAAAVSRDDQHRKLQTWCSGRGHKMPSALPAQATNGRTTPMRDRSGGSTATARRPGLPQTQGITMGPVGGSSRTKLPSTERATLFGRGRTPR